MWSFDTGLLSMGQGAEGLQQMLPNGIGKELSRFQNEEVPNTTGGCYNVAGGGACSRVACVWVVLFLIMMPSVASVALLKDAHAVGSVS